MSVEKELGALSQALHNIEKNLEKAEEGRKQTYQRLESMDRKLDHLDWRVKDLENKLNVLSPTVEEFAVYRVQVQGAGKLGSFLWKFGGFVLSAASGAAAVWAYFSTFFK